MRIVNLAVIKNALFGRLGGFERFKDFFEMSLGFGLELELTLLDGVDASKEISIALEEMPHFDEGIDNLNADFDRSLATEDC